MSPTYRRLISSSANINREDKKALQILQAVTLKIVNTKKVSVFSKSAVPSTFNTV